MVTLCGNDIFLPIARADPTVILASPHNGSAIVKLKAFKLAIVYTHGTTSALAVQIRRAVTGIAVETFGLRPKTLGSPSNVLTHTHEHEHEHEHGHEHMVSCEASEGSQESGGDAILHSAGWRHLKNERLLSSNAPEPSHVEQLY